MPDSPPALEGPKKKNSRGPLSRDEVVDGALAIIDAQGFDSLTMRSLGTRLNAYPASLYWHAGNRAQLLALVCQRVLETVDLPDVTIPWQDWVTQMARATRRSLSHHPNLAAYITSQLQVSIVSLTLAERTLTVLKNGGFEGEQLLMVYNTIMGTVFGWIAAEYAIDPDETDFEWRERFEQQLRLGGDDLPTLGELLPLVANRAFMLRWSSAKVMPMQGSFEFMLQTLIRGLEAATPERPGSPEASSERG
ncbi:hypothetical protein B7R54_18065 [Subtercola boreus]|uniref:HTH tetR-type domain-containing protein n=1 Tax=Subtercola boreus TaxID=120213 RepID=A0A3E0VN52_9MICO|nr:TetR/AcrR family transcriptional regulator [Subtercola boreus]RFA10900.1 hypothetical protein B7R54_18065 [Subtercola boreus]TQL55512.1 TetR family transcriptional regulator [Subtercola boreus]